ncbi:hypothetical protein GTP41_06365 [Pseudoduganella sp. DS3]|uniref:DUF2486 family protein n=1 Tax=Pseudoduganella guangdongensis TaxID=2692179 RepID=A0A6N9HE75_9BURK|nr:hypothetical protein [Pseudoduganella guangdongensis]MYN01720.1 hypothetical protein [Pseudoduganella guangdongensis]
MNQAFDASIPVLTEIMRDEAPAPAPAARSAAPAAAAATAPANDAPTPALPALDDAEAWDALERRLSERVLQQLSNRVDFVLEQRIKDNIHEVLNHALHALTVEIRDGLHNTIGKIVSRAVQQEIIHLQANSTRRK